MKRISRIADVVLAGTFLTLVALPLARFDQTPWNALIERRHPAVAPPPLQGLRGWTKWTAQVEAYIQDRFGLRGALLATRRIAILDGLHGSLTPRVEIGRDGWFFRTDVRAIDDLRGHPELDDAAVERWRKFLQARHDRLAALHIRYYFAPVPNKQTIYSELLRLNGPVVASTLDRLRASFPGGPPPWFIDLRPPIRAAKAQGKVYFAHDNHWNDWGAYIGYAALRDRLIADGVALHALKLERSAFAEEAIDSGDLAAMTQAQDLSELSLLYAGPPLPCTQQYKPSPVPGIVTAPTDEGDLTVDCPAAGNRTRVLILHDSMMIRQRRYLQTAFGHLRTMWTSVGEEGLEALVEAEHPDAIIDQRVEQNLAADLSPRPLPNVVIMAEAALPAAPSGWVHIDERNPAFWRVNGWALWHPDQETVRLRVATNLSVRGYLIDRVERGDVSAAQGDETLRNSGFRLRLQLDANAKMPSEPYLCLWSEDQDFGLRRLSFESEAHFDRCPG